MTPDSPPPPSEVMSQQRPSHPTFCPGDTVIPRIGLPYLPLPSCDLQGLVPTVEEPLRSALPKAPYACVSRHELLHNMPHGNGFWIDFISRPWVHSGKFSHTGSCSVLMAGAGMPCTLPPSPSSTGITKNKFQKFPPSQTVTQHTHPHTHTHTHRHTHRLRQELIALKTPP